LKVFVTGIIIIVSFVLQTAIFHQIPYIGVKPDLTTAVVVSLSIILGKDGGAIAGFAGGMIHDVMFSKPVGVDALSYMIVGYLVGMNSERIFKDNLVVPIIFTLGATVLRHSIIIFFYYVFNMGIPFLYYIRNIVLLEGLYNCITAVIIYKLLYAVYHKRFMEEGFKVKRSR